MTSAAQRHRLVLGCFAALLVGATVPHAAPVGSANSEWRTYGGDLRNTRYSPLDQINRDNFTRLDVAWRFKTDNLGSRPEFNLQVTPLVVDGVLYATGGSRRAAFALDAATGELRWVFGL